MPREIIELNSCKCFRITQRSLNSKGSRNCLSLNVTASLIRETFLIHNNALMRTLSKRGFLDSSASRSLVLATLRGTVGGNVVFGARVPDPGRYVPGDSAVFRFFYFDVIESWGGFRLVSVEWREVVEFYK